MKLSDTITQDALIEEMDRICGSTSNTYPYKQKVARLNQALDRYLSLAFEADNRWTFDDINYSSPAIDTQDIVSGTNRYKFGAFTNKIIDLVKLEILDDNGNGHTLIPEDFNNLARTSLGSESGVLANGISDSFEELYLQASGGTPTHYCKYGDFVYLRPSPNYNETSGLKAYFNRPASKFNFTQFTVTIASPGVFTSTSHGLTAGDTVILETTGALPTGLSVDTVYYVISSGLTTDAFQLSATSGGSAINTSVSQSGVHVFLKTNKVPGINELHHGYLARHASLPFLIEKKLPQLASVGQQILIDEQAIKTHFGNKDKDTKKRMIAGYQNNK